MREAWDSTLTGDAMTCLRKFYYLHVEGWRPRKLSVDLFFGGVYASCLEHYHKFLANGMPKEDAVLEVISKALYDTWFYDVDGKDGSPWVSDHNTKTRETLIRTLVWYVDTFDEDSMATIQLSSGPAVEFSFEIALTDNIIYCGHIDRLVEYQDDVLVQDQKTTARTLAPSYFMQYEHPNQQMTGYIFAGQIIYKQTVKGAVIDAAQIAVGFSRFERGFTFRTPDQLEEWRVNAQYAIGQANLENYPQNPTSCDKYGGCMFREVCRRSPSVRKQFLMADFEVKPLWNPQAKR